MNKLESRVKQLEEIVKSDRFDFTVSVGINDATIYDRLTGTTLNNDNDLDFTRFLAYASTVFGVDVASHYWKVKPDDIVVEVL